MISRRNYFSILLIFIATLLLFQGTQVGKEYWNDYNAKSPSKPTSFTKVSTWTSPELSFDKALRRDGVLYVGSKDAASASVVEEWARYAKRAFRRVDKLEKKVPYVLPGLVVVHGDALEGNTEAIEKWCEAGATVLCLGLPSPEIVVKSVALRRMLGVRSVRKTQVHLDGVHLFSGFLVGGERIYQEQEEDLEEKQDLELDVPWYTVREGTKTYMRGILPEEEWAEYQEQGLENEDGPALIWRNAYKTGVVFAVAGGYGEDGKMAMGICAAALSQREETLLYPVVNAYVVSVLNFPVCSNENGEVLLDIYGRELTDLERNIILPSLISLSSTYGITPTVFMTPQMDYDDGNEPDPELSHTFLSQLNEIGSEAAYGTQTRSMTSLANKLKLDEDYFQSAGIHYAFAATDTIGASLSELGDALRNPFLSGICTLLTEPAEDQPLFGYQSMKVSYQQLTSSAETHTFRQDLQMLCLETAVGYSSTFFDMEKVFWPETEEDEWQNASKRVFRNLTTYGAKYSENGAATVYESDRRIRRFLAMDYREEREGDVLSVEITNFEGEAWFLLRCFKEEVAKVVGGEAVKLEDGTFLIRADNPKIEVSLKQLDVLLYR